LHSQTISQFKPNPTSPVLSVLLLASLCEVPLVLSLSTLVLAAQGSWSAHSLWAEEDKTRSMFFKDLSGMDNAKEGLTSFTLGTGGEWMGGSTCFFLTFFTGLRKVSVTRENSIDI
jgi:hypothetical protein